MRYNFEWLDDRNVSSNAFRNAWLVLGDLLEGRRYRISYLLIDKVSVRCVRVSGQSRSGKDEQQTDGCQSQNAHQKVRDDVDQVSAFLAGHYAHKTAEYHNSSRPQTLKKKIKKFFRLFIFIHMVVTVLRSLLLTIIGNV